MQDIIEKPLQGSDETRRQIPGVGERERNVREQATRKSTKQLKFYNCFFLDRLSLVPTGFMFIHPHVSMLLLLLLSYVPRKFLSCRNEQ